MTLDDLLKLLTALGLSPLEVLTVVALVLVYRKNEALWQQVTKLQQSLDDCIDGLTGKTTKPPESH